MPSLVTSYEPTGVRRSVVPLQYHYGLTAVAMKGGEYARIPKDQIDAEMRKNRNLFARQLCGFTIPRDSAPEWFAEALLRTPGVRLITCRHPRNDGSIEYVDHIYLGSQIAFAPIVADRVIGDAFSSADAKNRAENLRRGIWSHVRVDENGKRRTSATIMIHLVGVVDGDRVVPFEYDATPAPMYVNDDEGGTLLRYTARTYQTDLLIAAVNAAAQLAGSATALFSVADEKLSDDEREDQMRRAGFPFAYMIVTGGQKVQQLTGNNEITLWTPSLVTKRGLRDVNAEAMQKLANSVKAAMSNPKTASSLLEELAVMRHGNDNLTLLLADDEVFEQAIEPLVASASSAEAQENGDDAAEEKEGGSPGDSPLF